MIKLSELKDDAIVIDENNRVYPVGDVKNDLLYFKDKEKKLYTTTEYHAHIDAKDMLESAIEREYENEMYEDWDQSIWNDIEEEDMAEIQIILDDIFGRNKSQNIVYYQYEEIEVDYE